MTVFRWVLLWVFGLPVASVVAQRLCRGTTTFWGYAFSLLLALATLHALAPGHPIVRAWLYLVTVLSGVGVVTSFVQSVAHGSWRR